jgi:hypothetical protein
MVGLPKRNVAADHFFLADALSAGGGALAKV